MTDFEALTVEMLKKYSKIFCYVGILCNREISGDHKMTGMRCACDYIGLTRKLFI